MWTVFVNKAPASLKIIIKNFKLIVMHFTQNQSRNFSIAPRTRKLPIFAEYIRFICALEKF